MSQSKYQVTGFSSSKGLPSAEEKLDKRQGFITWGKKNDYPFYLIDMYNGSAWHQGILKTKTYYIAGGGIVANGLDEFIANKYSDYTIEEIAQNMAFDHELFDAFAVLGTWNREGTRVVKWEHIDIDAIRMNETESLYFISDDWEARKQDPEKTGFRAIPPLDMNNKTGQFIIYYKSPHKKAKGEMGLYPKPNYIGGLTAINTDYLISQYHLYEIQNGFKGGTLVSMNNGVPETTEEAESYKRQIKGSTTDISDANEVIITFADGQDNAPTVLSLNGNDLADRYNLTEKSVQQNILVAHGATNPLLFGIKTEGQLGGATELMESYEIFKSLYVNSRQKTLEFVLNYMVELSGYTGTLELADAKPIEEKVQVEQKEQFRSAEKDLKIFSEYGSNKENFKIVKSTSMDQEFTAEDVQRSEKVYNGFFDKVGDIQSGLSDLDRNILSLLKEGENATRIGEATDAPLSEVVESINKLKDLNLIDGNQVTSLGNDVLEGLDIDIEQFEVRYSYEVRPGLGSEVIPTTRDFCRQLIDMNRMYLRSEIETISGRIGRDVWRYRGGFYHNPDTGRTTPWCRHEWRQHLVIKN